MTDHRSRRLYTNNQFLVFIENRRYRFSKISNIAEEAELEEFSVGGMNHTPHIARGPAKRSGRMTLEGGIADRLERVPLFPVGYRLEWPVEIIVSHSVFDAFLGRIYSVIGGTIVKWELGNLDAMGAEILIQKMEIAYEQIVSE